VPWHTQAILQEIVEMFADAAVGTIERPSPDAIAIIGQRALVGFVVFAGHKRKANGSPAFFQNSTARRWSDSFVGRHDPVVLVHAPLPAIHPEKLPRRRLEPAHERLVILALKQKIDMRRTAKHRANLGPDNLAQVLTRFGAVVFGNEPIGV